MDISKLAPNRANPRKISEVKLRMLEKSLREFGSLDGFVFNTRTQRLVGGHQRQRVFKNGKIVKVKGSSHGFVEWNGERFPYREVNWPEVKEKAANIAANKGAGEWDQELLVSWFSDLKKLDFDLDLTMFDEEERKEFLGEEAKKGNCDDDEVPEIKQTSIKVGDLFQLGTHRLLCGDSTDSASVSRLMNGEKADMVFTDPPYNLAENAGMELVSQVRKQSYEKLKNSEWDKGFDIAQPLKNINAVLSENSTVYVCTSHFLAGEIWKWMKEEFDYSGWCVFQKTNPMPSLSKRHWTWCAELICYATKGKQTFNFPSDGHALSVWLMSKISAAKEHPTEKPCGLPEHAIVHSSKPTDLVLDLFLGSGSTLIACEKTNRKCYGMEIDPQYVQVIIDRWEKFTGRKSSLIGKE